ncbi:16845_t:CDS:2 [Dentiscutata erythropus]|uniref:16845_t:CDS:1 n=1 Tax=Dentiscutata erythropus TaxID=1348616 RepID=A0A9N8YQJ4_9GLOM|nr:16845_t:CDS:2 [Dentiscutata erythropus]
MSSSTSTNDVTISKSMKFSEDQRRKLIGKLAAISRGKDLNSHDHDEKISSDSNYSNDSNIIPIFILAFLFVNLDLSIGSDYVNDSTIQIIAYYCFNLRVINLNNCIHITDSSLESLSIHHCASSLVSINLCGCRKITDIGIKMLSDYCQALTSLNVADCGKITDKSIIKISKGCPRLRQIRLSDCPRITEQSIEALILNCPRLCWLDIARIGRITDSTVRLIANKCKDNIEWLNLARPSPIEAVYSSALTTIANHSFSLICLTIIGCKLVTCESLRYLAQLRRKSGHLGCITMGDAVGITEEDIESITNEPEGLLSGWQKSSVDENSLKEILDGVSWDDVGTWYDERSRMW